MTSRRKIVWFSDVVRFRMKLLRIKGVIASIVSFMILP